MLKIIILFIVLFVPQNALADWVMLKNGDRLSGNIISETSDSVTIKSDLMGDITLNKAKVASMHKGNAPRVLARELRTGQALSNVPAQPVTTKVASPTSTPTPAHTAKKDEREVGVYKWSGRISAGGQLESGNSDSKSLTGDVDIKGRDKNNRFTLGAEANWAEEDGEKTDNDQQINGSYDRFVTDKWFVGARQSFEKDEFEALDLRSQTGVFAGYQFYERDDLNLQVRSGPEYIYEKLENGNTDSDLTLAWALDYDQKLYEDTVQIFHKHEFNAPFSDLNAYLFESETGVRMPIGKVLDASFQVDFDWDNDPADGIVEDDTTYGVKLGYGW